MKSGFNFRMKGFVPADFKQGPDTIVAATKFYSDVKALAEKVGMEFEDEHFMPGQKREAGDSVPDSEPKEGKSKSSDK